MASGAIYELISTSGGARLGKLSTSHGVISTPAFMPVATQGSIKTLTTDEVGDLGAQIILANAYHLYLQPGVDVIQRLGGLHKFCRWERPILTDSGGFQAYSLGSGSKVSDDGITFRSHVDGSSHYLTPESAVGNQLELGVDVAMCLDQCIAFEATREQVQQAMDRTHRWAQRSKTAHGQGAAPGQYLFGIVQGGLHADLRRESAELITTLGFDGYAIGGLGVGEAKGPMYEMSELTAGMLPSGRPRYLMGVGSPEDLVEGVASGIDLFDCALPTRVARNGSLFTTEGRVDITHRRFQDVTSPIEEGCDCYACRRFSAGYVRHLFKAREILGLRLATLHNLRFILRLMEGLQGAIQNDEFPAFRKSFLGSYVPTNQEARLEQKKRWVAARGIPFDC